MAWSSWNRDARAENGAQLIDKLLMSLGWVEFKLFPIVFDLPVDGVTQLMGRLIAHRADLLIKVSACCDTLVDASAYPQQ